MSQYLAEGLEASQHPLRRDVRMLGFELGRVIRQHAGEAMFGLVEQARALAKQRRDGDPEAEGQLQQLMADLDLDQMESLIRALACYFSLANLAEDRHRVRVLRERERDLFPDPRRESIGDAVRELVAKGMMAKDIEQLVASLHIEPVFTAHPTEARRRSVTRAIRRVRQDLIDLDDPRLLPSERMRLMTRIQTDLDVLWETDLIRTHKPTVLEEVKRSLFVVESLWDIAPRLVRSMRRALEQVQPGLGEHTPRFLTFGTWIGGDRDGNPFVTAGVTRATLIQLRQEAIKRHVRESEALFEKLSISSRHHPISDELQHALDHACEHWPDCAQAVRRVNETELYRRWLTVVRYRLEKTAQADPFEGLPDAAYRSAEAFRDDVMLIRDSLAANEHEALASGELTQWLDRVDIFGFHIARLDIREDSGKLHQAVGELLSAMRLTNSYVEMSEEEKVHWLTQPIDQDRALALSVDQLSPETRQTWELFVLLEKVARTFGDDSLGALIVSMTHHPSDVLTMLWLSQVAAAWCGDQQHSLLPIVPLFETIDDLDRASSILDGLYQHDAYRQHVAKTDQTQMVMVGYSDSCKDGGYLASNWMLHRGQSDIAQATERAGVKLMVFHGRGGSLGRGGGPAARGIKSLPSASVDGRVRLTEQGEVLAERYDDPEIARRHLEQLTWATMLVTAQKGDDLPDAWTQALSQASEVSFDHYRAFREHPTFLDYFNLATPIDAIESLPIGSRPSRRGGKRDLSSLRAIPYTFAWTQSRHLLTGFYGLGTGLTQAAQTHGWEVFQEMYQKWSLVTAIVDNAELALSKADLSIAHLYAGLASQWMNTDELWQAYESEYQRTREALTRITGREGLLEPIPWLARSIEVRNPYVDPLNVIQIELMKRARNQDAADSATLDRLNELIRFSVQAIALGLRTTG